MNLSDISDSLDEIAQRTLSATDASRVTIRLESVDFDVAAEALTPGIPSVKGSRPNRAAILVVDRVLRGETVIANEVEQHLAPDDPRARYQITAEIVTPILRGAKCVGVLSVHDSTRMRDWDPRQVRATRRRRGPWRISSTTVGRMIMLSTFSVAARCRHTGMLGAAASTAFPAVGALCPHVAAGAGAVCTQAWLNVNLGIDGVALLRQGESAQRVLTRILAEDPDPDTTGRDRGP